MRIAYVCADPGVPVYGCKGASVHVQEVIRAMIAAGHGVDLLAARTGGEPPGGLEGVPVHPLQRPPLDVPSAEREARLRAAGATAADALGGAGPFDLIYERYSLWGCSAMRWAAATGIPGVLEVNAPLPEEQQQHRTLHDRAAADAVAHGAVTAASVVVAVSGPVARWVAEVGAAAGGCPNVHVVPNAVDVDRFHPGDRAPASGAECTVGFVGTLKAWHGLETLAEAFGRLAPLDPGFRLLVVGDGPGRPTLEQRFAAEGLTTRVDMVGATAPADVPSLLHRIDIAVAPYPPSAGYFSPLKLYEYLAAGLPVVASDVGQVGEVLEHGRTGLLCRPGHVGDLVSAVTALRAAPEWAAALGRAGRAMVEQRHSWRVAVDRILSLAADARMVRT